MKLSKPLGFLMILSGIAVMIGPWTFAPACLDMDTGDAACQTTRLWALAAGAVILLIGLILMKVRNYILAKFMTILLFAAGVATMFLPLLIAPVCSAKDMPCRARMLPFLMIMGGVIALLGILFLLKGVKRPEPETRPEPAKESKESPEPVAEQVPETAVEQEFGAPEPLPATDVDFTTKDASSDDALK